MRTLRTPSVNTSYRVVGPKFSIALSMLTVYLATVKIVHCLLLN